MKKLKTLFLYKYKVHMHWHFIWLINDPYLTRKMVSLVQRVFKKVGHYEKLKECKIEFVMFKV